MLGFTRLTVMMSRGVDPVLLQRRGCLKLPAAVVAPVMLVRSLPMLLERVFARERAFASITVSHALVDDEALIRGKAWGATCSEELDVSLYNTRDPSVFAEQIERTARRRRCDCKLPHSACCSPYVTGTMTFSPYCSSMAVKTRPQVGIISIPVTGSIAS